ncbi:hypothetical protein [Blautia wexlerae]|uniref:hypothetical protein n=1 Tax=Blautia wexlerae TaxID=418240 RepID=UPI00156D820A|nr:hypothetical protein [Blautia wexlerae]NSD46611.1 hypothetical protein [Blautia wexlerae]NSD50503.1 hypothetical protein [Blautia wexlerae]NSK03222.1 hypothetical protein [Blautia wexlerae]NSK40495.1 hypothetical protein [Blautia wexlerae]
MSKKNYKYVPCVKYGDNSGWMGDKFSTMQKAWDYLMEYKKKYDTSNNVVFIGVIKCKKDENPFTRIVDIGIRSYNAWE